MNEGLPVIPAIEISSRESWCKDLSSVRIFYFSCFNLARFHSYALEKQRVSSSSSTDMWDSPTEHKGYSHKNPVDSQSNEKSHYGLHILGLLYHNTSLVKKKRHCRHDASYITKSSVTVHKTSNVICTAQNHSTLPNGEYTIYSFKVRA